MQFRLSEEFLTQFKLQKPKFGYKDAGGNSVGELTFIRTYSRKKPDGTKERWWEVCQRVIDGMYEIQKQYCLHNELPWNNRKAQISAQEAYTRMFQFKWTPPGRGLWAGGTDMVMNQRNSSPLQNCAFISTKDMTKDNPGEPFAFLMEASMLGIGVGFDVLGADKGFEIHGPGCYGITRNVKMETYVIPDTRQGWAESTRMLINSYLCPEKPQLSFDYSEIRPAGEPINTFGGTAAGPEPLRLLHEGVRELFSGRGSNRITSLDIMDIMNMIGVCVVSGNVRRSAELAQGSLYDKDFLNAKNYEANSYREAWGWMSNNTVAVNVGDDLSSIVEGIKSNGEPGVTWLDVTRARGRLADPINNKDYRVAGWNPCAEQPLESGEMCTLVETYLNNCESEDDFNRTLKFAYLYAKTVTLLPTHWPKTNSIMQRNRRIGISVSGIANFADNHSASVLRRWVDNGYSTVQKYDKTYSEWLCVRESIKTTTVKPSGTVSILAGESPGVHWGPGGSYFLRGIVFSSNDPIVKLFRDSGYKVEDSVYNPGNSVFVQFPVHSKARRSEKDVTLFEKANLAAMMQRYWSDNGVSVTLSFNPATEGDQIGTILSTYEGQFKAISFLPMSGHEYRQAPYQPLTAEEYEEYTMNLLPLDLESLYLGTDGLDAEGEKFCTTDVCEIKAVTND